MLVAVSVVVMMSMMMTVALAGVSAGFRLERQLAKGHRQAELAQHIVQHVIVMVAQLARHNLQRYVTVAEVIAGLRQHKRVVAAHHRHPFISGNHLHKLGAFFVAEHIAAAQQQAALEARIAEALTHKKQTHFLHQGNTGITQNLSYIGG